MFTFRDVQRIPQGQGSYVKYRGNVNLYIYTVYRSNVWTHYYLIFLQEVTYGHHELHLFDQKFEYSLKYIFCNADLLSMLETFDTFFRII